MTSNSPANNISNIFTGLGQKIKRSFQNTFGPKVPQICVDFLNKTDPLTPGPVTRLLLQKGYVYNRDAAKKQLEKWNTTMLGGRRHYTTKKTKKSKKSRSRKRKRH